MDKFNEIKSLIEATEKDIEAFFVKGNKSAGTRVRSAMQTLKQLAQDVRTSVQEAKNSTKA
jgi:hypothetical protein